MKTISLSLAVIFISFAAKAQLVDHSKIPAKKYPPKKYIYFHYIPSGKPIDTVACILVGSDCNPETRIAKTISLFGYVIEKTDRSGTTYSVGYLNDNKQSISSTVFIWFTQPYIIVP